MGQPKVKHRQFDAIRRQMRKARPRKANYFIAHNLIVRTLRAAGLSHILKGKTAVVGFLYPSPFPLEWLVEASDLLLRQTTARRHLCIEFSSQARHKSRNSKRDEFVNSLIENDVVFGFATDIKHFPEAFRVAAYRNACTSRSKDHRGHLQGRSGKGAFLGGH
jgi:hypothetical protein